MANVTTTTAANFIPEMWRDAILDYAERKFILRNQLSDFSSMVSNGATYLISLKLLKKLLHLKVQTQQ